MAAEERWYFTKEKLLSTPSRKCGVDPDKELSYRQQAANFIQDMGQRLQVNQLCINTAIVYVHRFYMFHSFTRFHRNAISTCALFLAAKVEEQPRKLEHVIKVAHMCLHREAPPLDSKSEAYLEQSQELISNENIMLQTLGFDVAIDHPHTHVVKCCQLVRGHHHHATASKELAQTSYFMATNSLHLTTMCLQYKPTVVACVCIHLACKWAELQIPMSSEGKDWYWYVDKTVTFELLEELTAEFLVIFDRCPSRLKRKMMSSTGMNDKIQDVAMVEKKLTAEFAAHASGNRAASAAASSSGSSRGSSDKSDRHRSHNASWPSSMTAKVLGHDDRNSDAEQNGGTPVTPEVRRERTSSSKRDAVNCATSKSTVINCANTSAASMSKSSGSSTFTSSSSSSPPPQTMVSPVRPSSRQMSSTADLGYSSMTSSNSQASQEHMVIKQEPASPPPPPPSTVELTPKKIKSEFGSGRGMTPKEYRERKKRERAVELAVEEKAHLLETPKEPTPQPSSQSRKRTSSSGSESSGSMLSLARHMQPIVALTSLNLTELTNKIPSSKHVLISAKHSRHLTTPEKQPRSSSSTSSSTTTVTGDGDHNNGRHKRILVVDDGAPPTTAAVQRVNRGEDPLPALVRPPILTPSPPLATGEESKPDILEERPMTLSFPCEDMVLGIESPPPQPLQHLPQSCHTTTAAFEPTIQVKVEKDDTRARTTYPVHSSFSAAGLQPAASSAKRSDVKQTIKDRLIKHRKSRTQPKEPVVPPPLQTATETLSVPQAVASTGFSPGVVAGAKPSDFRTVSPLNVTTMTPITRFTGSHPLAATTDENVAAAAAASSSSVTTQEQQRYPPLNLNTNSTPQTTTTATELVQMVERKKQTNTKPPASSATSAQAPAVVVTAVNSASEVLVSFENRTSEKIHQFAPIPTPTPSTSSSVKHERKERHKHKDREKTKSSRGDKAGKGGSSSSSSAAPVVVAVQPPEQLTVQAPAIKLTIPKDRLNMTVVDVGKVAAGGARGVAAQVANDSIGGLKIRIPKRKISASKTSKTVVEAVPAKIAPPPASSAVAAALAAPMQLAPVIATATMAMTTASVASSAIVPPKEPAIGGGLKIKITKDRLGSMGTYSVGSREDNYKDKRTSEKESRKRERPPSPPLPYPSHPQPPLVQQPPPQQQQQQSRPLIDVMPQKTTLLPLPTGIAQAAPPMAPMSSSGSVSPKPAKMAKLASRSGRKSQSPQATLVMSPYDVPPSSNTRSSSKQDQPQRSDNYKPPSGRGHRGSGKHRGRGGHGHQPPLQHPHPRFDASHQVTMNAGPYPYTPYYQYPPNFFSHPPIGPLPRHPHGPPMHPGDYPPPPFFGQPPPFRGPLPMAGGPAYQGPRPDSRVMPPLQIRRQFPPPLPSEPPPAIPPPPPPE